MLAKNRKRIIIASCCFMAVIAISLLPTYRYFKQFNAERHASAALELMAAGNYAAAKEKAHAAYHLAPANPEICRVVAQLYEDIDPGLAATFWQEAYVLSDDLLDLKNVVEYSLLAGQLDGLEASLDELEEALPNNGEVLFLRADWLLRNRQIDEALIVAQRLVRLADAPEDAHFFYVQVSQFSDDPSLRRAGLDYLRELTLRKDDLGLESLRNLAVFDRNTEAQVREIFALIDAHPLAERTDQLVALKALIELPGSEVGSLVAQAKSYFDLTDLADLTELGRWLNSVRLHSETVRTIHLEQAMKRKDLFLVLLDAMAVLNMWEEIGVALDDRSIPIDTYLRLLFEARVGLETGSTQKADIAWSRAKLAVANEPQKLWFLANYAKRLSLFKEARSVLERLTEIPSSMRKAYEELIRLEQKQGETRRLRDTFVKMMEVYPTDIAVMNDLAYTNLLLNENIDSASERAEHLVDMNPKYLANRITLALAYYRSNDSAHALKVLRAVNVDWEQVKVGWRAVYAAILRDSGLATEADAILSGIDPSMLLPEEKKLLSRPI